MNKRKVGSDYEEIAARFIEDRGIRIIDHNVYCGKIGEIDLIGRGEGCLIFFEVKYRKNNKSGYALEAITPAKIEKCRRCAQYYLQYKQESLPVRFDCIGIDGDEITWVKDAF